MAKKQKALPGMERETNAEVDAAAELFLNRQTKYAKAGVEKKVAKEGLIAAMQKARLTSYKDEEAGLVVMLTEGKPSVKVKEIEDSDEGDDEEAEAA
jgi:hypothetical protein